MEVVDIIRLCSSVATVLMTVNYLRNLYDWVLSFSESPYGTIALFLIAVAESSFFPVPPDVLLLALCVGSPHRAFWFALVTTAGSLLGAAVGYLLGLEFYELIGRRIIEFYGAEDRYTRVAELYQEWDAIAVGIAGFTPIPYKVFTIAAGVFRIDFLVFMIASLLSRSARFFLVAALIWRFGKPIRDFIDRYLGWLTIIFSILLIGGFVLIKYFLE